MLTIFNAFVTSSPSGTSLLLLMRNSWVWKHQCSRKCSGGQEYISLLDTVDSVSQRSQLFHLGIFIFSNHALFSSSAVWKLICRWKGPGEIMRRLSSFQINLQIEKWRLREIYPVTMQDTWTIHFWNLSSPLSVQHSHSWVPSLCYKDWAEDQWVSCHLCSNRVLDLTEKAVTGKLSIHVI